MTAQVMAGTTDTTMGTTASAAPSATETHWQTSLENSGTVVRHAVLDLRGGLAALGLGGFLLYFGVTHTLEAGSYLIAHGWRPGAPLPALVPFAHAPGSIAAQGSPFGREGDIVTAVSHLPFDEALGIVLFSLVMGLFLFTTGIRAVRNSSRRAQRIRERRSSRRRTA